MTKKIIALLFLLFLLFSFSTILFAQTTNITATITDNDGITWTSAQWSVSFVTNGIQSNPCIYQLNGQSLCSNTWRNYLNQNGTSDPSTGAISVTLLDNTQITPSGTKFVWTVQSNTSAPATQYAPLTISGASMNLNSFLSVNSIAPRFSAVGPQSFGYADIEVNPTPNPGAYYYNVTNQTTRQWSGPPTNVWQNLTTSSWNGGTVSNPITSPNGNSGNLAQKNSSSDAIKCVQLNSGNDSNDGTCPGSGYLTIGACLTALNTTNGGTCNIYGSGTVNLASGITISQQNPITLNFITPVNLNFTGTGCMFTIAGGAPNNEPTAIIGMTPLAAIWSQSSNFGTTFTNSTSGNSTICLTGYTSNYTIKGVTINNGSGVIALNIEPTANTNSSSGGIIYGNLFIGGSYGIYENSSHGILQHFNIEMNGFKNQTIDAIHLDFAVANSGNDLNFKHNWIYEPGAAGINLVPSGNGAYSVVNITDGNEIDCSSTSSSGITSTSIQSGTIVGNDIESCNQTTSQSSLNIGGNTLTISSNHIYNGCGASSLAAFIIQSDHSDIGNNSFIGGNCTTGVVLTNIATHNFVKPQVISGGSLTTEVSDGGTNNCIWTESNGFVGSNCYGIVGGTLGITNGGSVDGATLNIKHGVVFGTAGTTYDYQWLPEDIYTNAIWHVHFTGNSMIFSTGAGAGGNNPITFNNSGGIVSTANYQGTNLILTGGAPSVSTGQFSFGNGISTTVSNCGSLTGSTKCLIVKNGGTTEYIPLFP